MKKSLFLYLFVLAALMNVFTYAYFSGETKSVKADLTAQIKKQNKSILKQKDSILLLYNDLQDANYFSLENNQNAQEYLADYDIQKLIPKIKDQIMTLNENPKGNSLIPYEQINNQKFIVNKIKVLNHRWVIADFSDGKVWGELLLKYFVESEDKVSFERIDSQLYQPQK